MAGKGGYIPGSGRPKGAVNKNRAEIRNLITDKMAEKLIKKLNELATAGNTDAIKYILDQKFGRATQRQEISGPEGQLLGINIYLPEKKPIDKTT